MPSVNGKFVSKYDTVLGILFAALLSLTHIINNFVLQIEPYPEVTTHQVMSNK